MVSSIGQLGLCDAVTLVDDTIILKDKETYIVYSPFTGLISRISEYPAPDKKIYQILQGKGFFLAVPETTMIDKKWHGFYSLTLLLTRRCNLGCTYCYAFAKPNGASMPVDIALGAVEWFANQAPKPKLRITFHGGGEPTLEQNLIKIVVKRVGEIRRDRKATFLITTNGTATKKFIDWMMDKKFGISVSMDGPPEIQNRNRPFIGGGPSSTVVENNIRYLVTHSYPFTIRVTYSSADDIVKIVRYFGDLGVKKLHLEPLFPYGRNYNAVEFGKKSHYEVYSPTGGELVKKFVQAMDICREYGIKIYNGHLIHFTRGIGYFCGSASGKSMVVSHDGLITGCLEVVDSEDKDSVPFLLGHWIPNDRSFSVDLDKIKKFQNRHADTLTECKDCFARYSCAGGCSVKAVRATGNFLERDIPYCNFTKALLPILIKRIAKASGI